MSSTGLTNPRPKSCAQVRLTIALAKNGFSGRGHPLRQHRAVRLGAGRAVGSVRRRGTSAGTRLGRLGQEVLRLRAAGAFGHADLVVVAALVRVLRVVGLHLREERGHAPVLGLLPVGERVVVALGTLELHAEEVLADGVGQLVHGAVGEEVGDGRVVLDGAGRGDEAGDELVPAARSC